MNTQTTIELLKQHGLKFEDFVEWMYGQTHAIVDGEPAYYEWDVKKFIRGNGCTKCDCRFAPIVPNHCPCACHA